MSYKYKSKHVNFDCSKIDDSLLEDPEEAGRTEEFGRTEEEKGTTAGMANENN